jgi:Domain of unknown function (DUF4129)
LAAVCAITASLFAAARMASAADAAKPRVTVPQYEAELDRLVQAVKPLAAHPEEIDQVRNSLPDGWTVAADGQEYEVTLGWLSGTLATMKKDKADRQELDDQAIAWLAGLKTQAESLASADAAPSSSDARLKLEAILRQREFRTVHTKSWLAEAWEQLQRWIDWLLTHTVGKLVEPGAVKTVAVWILIATVFVIAAFWLVRGLMTLVRGESLRMQATFPPGKLWRDWAREALDASGKSDYRAAIHSLYWAGIYRLAELGAWQLDLARTPREYLRLLARRPENSEGYAGAQQGSVGESEAAARKLALTALTRSMESAWYGYTPATPQDFESAVDQLETLGCRFRSTVQTARS